MRAQDDEGTMWDVDEPDCYSSKYFVFGFLFLFFLFFFFNFLNCNPPLHLVCFILNADIPPKVQSI